MRRVNTLPRFDRGVISDRNDIKGSMTYCNNMYPINGGRAWRTRRGKKQEAVHGSLTFSSGLEQCYHLDGTQLGDDTVLGIGTISGNPQFVVRGTSTNSNTLPTQALDNSGSARTFTGFTNRFAFSAYRSAHLFNYELYVTGDRTNLPTRSAGSTGSTSYTSGTVSGTSGTKVITGSSTTWTSSHVGSYIWVNDTTINERAYRITRLISATSIEVDAPLATTFSAKNYRIDSLTPWTVKPGTFGSWNQTGTISSHSMMNCAVVSQHGGRMFGASSVEYDNRLYKDRLRWSAALDEYSSHWGGAEYWHANAYIDVFPGEGGDLGIYGLASYNGSLYIFKQNAVFKLKGFVETDGTDVGASVVLVSKDHGQYDSFIQPIVDKNGVWFVSETGLCLVNDSGVVNFTEQTGVSKAFIKYIRSGGGYNCYNLSVMNDRIILQSMQDFGDSFNYASDTIVDTPNTMIYWKNEKVWSTQSTLLTTRVQQLSLGFGMSFVYSTENANVKNKIAYWGREDINTSDPTYYTENDGTNNAYPIGHIISNPLQVSELGSVAKIKSILTRYYLLDIDNLNPSISVAALPGEFELGSPFGVSANGDSLYEILDSIDDEDVETTRVSRVYGGLTGYDAYSFSWKQTDGADFILYEFGLDVINAKRVR